MCLSETRIQTAYAFFLHSLKLRDLLEYVYTDLKEYVLTH